MDQRNLPFKKRLLTEPIKNSLDKSILPIKKRILSDIESSRNGVGQNLIVVINENKKKKLNQGSFFNFLKGVIKCFYFYFLSYIWYYVTTDYHELLYNVFYEVAFQKINVFININYVSSYWIQVFSYINHLLAKAYFCVSLVGNIFILIFGWIFSFFYILYSIFGLYCLIFITLNYSFIFFYAFFLKLMEKIDFWKQKKKIKTKHFEQVLNINGTKNNNLLRNDIKKVSFKEGHKIIPYQTQFDSHRVKFDRFHRITYFNDEFLNEDETCVQLNKDLVKNKKSIIINSDICFHLNNSKDQIFSPGNEEFNRFVLHIKCKKFWRRVTLISGLNTFP